MGVIQPIQPTRERKRIVWQDAYEYLSAHPIPDIRLATEFPTLNRVFGGGLWPIMVLVLQGAPGAGKSSFGTQLAAHCALKHGSKVYIYAPDEGTRAACVRLGQYVGIDRDLLERTRPEAIDAFRRAYGPGTVNTYDADEPEALLETFLDQIAEEHVPGSPPPFFYADSVQTMATDMDDSFDGPRFQIGYIMQALRKSTRKVPMIAGVVSHVNRTAFASKDPEQRTDPLASAAEAQQISRAADVIIHLDGEIHEGVKAWVRKNRLFLGEKPKIDFQYDVPRGAFLELDQAVAEDLFSSQQDAKNSARSAAREAAKQKEQERIVAELASDAERRITAFAPQRLSQRQLHELVGGKFPLFKMALRSLENTNFADAKPGPNRSILWGRKGSE